MRRHQKIQEDLYAYLRNEMPPEERAAIDAHLKSCAACAAELKSMREVTGLLALKGEKPSERRTEMYWQQFAEKVEQRIQLPLTEEEPQSFVGRLLDLVSEHRRPFSYGFASALSLMVLAFAIWSFWIKAPTSWEIASDASGGEMTVPGAAIQKTAMEVRAGDYLEQSKILLIGIMNTDTKSLVESNSLLDRQREVSRTLVRESQEISSGLTDPSQQRLRELVSDLGLILMQISNLGSEHGAQGVEIVKGGVERNGILFKINLEEIRRAAQASQKNGKDKQAKSTI